jgi:hypothetical protein
VKDERPSSGGESDDDVGEGAPQNSTRRIVRATSEIARKRVRAFQDEQAYFAHEQNTQRIQYEHQLNTKMVEIGYVGRFFGSTQVVFNIVAVAAVILSLLILISVWAAVSQKELQIFQVVGLPLLSALTLILGYLFGRGGKQSQ